MCGPSLTLDKIWGDKYVTFMFYCFMVLLLIYIVFYSCETRSYPEVFLTSEEDNFIQKQNSKREDRKLEKKMGNKLF